MSAESTLLTANREELVKNIRFVEPFLDKLLQTNQLTAEECEVVRSGRTPQDRARALIDLVGTKGQEAFGHFRHVLKETNPELADILHRCTEHNEKIKLHCDDCVQLLCRTCNKEGHRGHSVSSIVADASAIRREVTAFVRDNRKSLKSFKASASNVESRQNVLMDIERRKNELKAIFIAKVESEYEWCKDQLGVVGSVGSPAASISSIATTDDELSGKNRSDTECQCSPTAKIRIVSSSLREMISIYKLIACDKCSRARFIQLKKTHDGLKPYTYQCGLCNVNVRFTLLRSVQEHLKIQTG
uniref:B box-type domain-containing protein n=1 Tax=Branchiostoma floridae TaxID=7739 RepID=C3YX00_BRAFL|eukprot:XP_002599382.1 hypothetical protein BRAFLDRAFT_64260 [Branchiostoma floridae]